MRKIEKKMEMNRRHTFKSLTFPPEFFTPSSIMAHMSVTIRFRRRAVRCHFRISPSSLADAAGSSSPSPSPSSPPCSPPSRSDRTTLALASSAALNPSSSSIFVATRARSAAGLDDACCWSADSWVRSVFSVPRRVDVVDRIVSISVSRRVSASVEHSGVMICCWLLFFYIIFSGTGNIQSKNVVDRVGIVCLDCRHIHCSNLPLFISLFLPLPPFYFLHLRRERTCLT